MIDWTKPIRTKEEGLPARVIGTGKHYVGYQHVVAIDFGGHEMIGVCGDDGVCKYSPTKGITIVNVPKKHSLWVNVYHGCGFGPTEYDAFGYASKEKADKVSGLGRLACVRVEFEEGEGL